VVGLRLILVSTLTLRAFIIVRVVLGVGRKVFVKPGER